VSSVLYAFQWAWLAPGRPDAGALYSILHVSTCMQEHPSGRLCPLCFLHPHACAPLPPSPLHHAPRTPRPCLHPSPLPTPMHDTPAAGAGGCSRRVLLQHVQHQIYFCNIYMKHLQHTPETSEILPKHLIAIAKHMKHSEETLARYV
jgi:hypothetical protein